MRSDEEGEESKSVVVSPSPLFLSPGHAHAVALNQGYANTVDSSAPRAYVYTDKRSL